MKLTDLQTAIADLSSATLADPLLALCSAIAWVDPLILQPQRFAEEVYPFNDPPDEWLNIAIAWEITRQCCVDVYAETTLAIRSPHLTEAQIEQQVCQGFNRHLVGVDIYDLEQIHYGLPFFGCGVELTSPEFFAVPQHTPLVEVYALFNVEVGQNSPYSHPDNYSQAATTATILAHSLRLIGNSHHQKLAWLLDWMFAQTGNTSADYSEEEMYDMGSEPLQWDAYDIAFSNTMHTEAMEIVEQAQQGLQLLMGSSVLQQNLRRNIRKISPKVSEVKRYDLSDTDAHQLAKSLRWVNDPEPVDADCPAAHAESVPFRRADAA